MSNLFSAEKSRIYRGLSTISREIYTFIDTTFIRHSDSHLEPCRKLKIVTTLFKASAKRKNCKSETRANLLTHKSKIEIYLRLRRSTRASNGTILGTINPLKIEKPKNILGFACPECSGIKVRSNVENVFQHYTAKHGSDMSKKTRTIYYMDHAE